MLIHQSALCDAIAKQKVIELRYDDADTGFRIAEPYLIGVTHKDNLVLVAFQTRGASESDKYVGWKMFELEKIFALNVTSTYFPMLRSDYNRNDSRMTRIICRI